MAAPSRKMVGVSEDSSSSDDEVLRRCQEAVWETKTEKNKDGDTTVPPSKRVVVAEHEHDGNELQVTKGFQTHVAKKLGNYLDSYITEMRTEQSTCVDSAKCDEEEDDDDEGFRLFSSSVPGQKADDPPAPVRRRPAPSSSDSDSEMEMRLKEVAVSVKDLLPSTSPSSSLQTPSEEPPCTEKVKKKKKKKATEGEESDVKKKKKEKRKKNQEESDCAASPVSAQNNGEHGNSEQEHAGVKVKKKKKKQANTTD
ncbi:protein CUSTOS [Xyrichtys novacula]|uniref:Protein CUSTOS n=1 Tax=Xyrichtys novacula TaxID=13765 RepID=A0AAV1G634_XYRNO|nr:protein CUSTOS [Xyrichtys novacula]